MVLQRETSPPYDLEKRMRKPMEKDKEEKSRWGVNRVKLHPKQSFPQRELLSAVKRQI